MLYILFSFIFSKRIQRHCARSDETSTRIKGGKKSPSSAFFVYGRVGPSVSAWKTSAAQEIQSVPAAHMLVFAPPPTGTREPTL